MKKTLVVFLVISETIQGISTDPSDFSAANTGKAICRSQRQQDIIHHFEANQCPGVYPSKSDLIKIKREQQKILDSNVIHSLFDASALGAVSGGIGTKDQLELANKLATRASVRCSQLSEKCIDIGKKIVQNLTLSLSSGNGSIADIALNLVIKGIEEEIAYLNEIKLVFLAPIYVEQRVDSCKRDVTSYHKIRQDVVKETDEVCLKDAVSSSKVAGTQGISSIFSIEAQKSAQYYPIGSTMIFNLMGPFTNFCEVSYLKCFNVTSVIGQYIARAILQELKLNKSADQLAGDICRYAEELYGISARAIFTTMSDVQNLTKKHEMALRSGFRDLAEFMVNSSGINDSTPPFNYIPML